MHLENERKQQNERKSLQIVYLVRDLYQNIKKPKFNN